MDQDGLALLQLAKQDELEVCRDPGFADCCTLLPAEALWQRHHKALRHSNLFCISAKMAVALSRSSQWPISKAAMGEAS